jgi:hypothetical protein
VETSEFLDFLWGGLDGFARFATRDAKGAFNEKHFFKWPEEREAALEWIEGFSGDYKDVWMSPALFKDNKSVKKSNVKVAQVSWGDYDQGLKELIDPAVAVMSSPGRFHCYWKHPPSKVIEQIEHRNKEHAYADDCWNADRLMRVPGSTNARKQWRSSVLPELGPINFLSVTQQEVFYRGVPEGERGRKLYGLAASLAETGASRDVVDVLIRDADSRWGKFTGPGSRRTDGDRRLTELVDRVFTRVSISGESTVVPLLGWKSLKESPGANLQWILEGFLYRGALGAISGPPGVGKTQLCLRLCAALVLGQDFLKFKNLGQGPERILFLSYEMGPQELNEFKNLMSDLAPKEEDLEERIKFKATGYSQIWGSKTVQAEIEADVLDENITGIVVDSLGSTSAKSLNDDLEVKTILDFADRLRNDYGVWVLFLHHQRKEDSAGKRKPNGLADLFGSMYVGGRIRTALILWPGEVKGDIEVSTPKTTLAKEGDPFWIRRTPVLDFELIATQDAIARQAVEKRVNKKLEKSEDFIGSLAVDFDILDEDE